MAERICSADDCEKLIWARGLCKTHYGKAYREGLFPKAVGWHRLTNLDVEQRVADCSVCGPGVPVKVRSTSQRGRAECLTQRRRNQHSATRSATSSATRREYRLKWKYGITENDYQHMLDEQRGLCAVCEQPSEHRLCVDHDHETGQVRGLLCRMCNLSLGYLRDDSYNAVSAAKYLLKVIRARST